MEGAIPGGNGAPLQADLETEEWTDEETERVVRAFAPIVGRFPGGFRLFRGSLMLMLINDGTSIVQLKLMRQIKQWK